MNQDKLEEIARLLGGISDKLDVVRRKQTELARALDVFEEVPLFGGYPPLMDKQEAEASAQRARDRAHKAVFGPHL